VKNGLCFGPTCLRASPVSDIGVLCAYDKAPFKEQLAYEEWCDATKPVPIRCGRMFPKKCECTRWRTPASVIPGVVEQFHEDDFHAALG